MGYNDCGIFALAFVTAFSFGIDPCSLFFKQELMRPHLTLWFENSAVKPVPFVNMQERWKTVLFTVEIEIICFYRLPKCGQWYHISCVNPAAACCMLCTAKLRNSGFVVCVDL